MSVTRQIILAYYYSFGRYNNITFFLVVVSQIVYSDSYGSAVPRHRSEPRDRVVCVPRILLQQLLSSSAANYKRDGGGGGEGTRRTRERRPPDIWFWLRCDTSSCSRIRRSPFLSSARGGRSCTWPVRHAPDTGRLKYVPTYVLGTRRSG